MEAMSSLHEDWVVPVILERRCVRRATKQMTVQLVTTQNATGNRHHTMTCHHLCEADMSYTGHFVAAFCGRLQVLKANQMQQCHIQPMLQHESNPGAD